MECNECKGRGEIYVLQDIVPGGDGMPQEIYDFEECGNCEGTGEEIENE